MFNKRGSPEPTLSVHDGATGQTKSLCGQCGKMSDVVLDKQAFVAGEKRDTKCPHCAHPIGK